MSEAIVHKVPIKHKISDVLGSKITLFGGRLIDPEGYVPLGYIDFSWGQENVFLRIADGKTFKLWAMGQTSTDYPDYVKLRVRNPDTAEIVHETALGALYEEYSVPYTAAGPCILQLEAYNGYVGGQTIGGFMVFSIE